MDRRRTKSLEGKCGSCRFFTIEKECTGFCSERMKQKGRIMRTYKCIGYEPAPTIIEAEEGEDGPAADVRPVVRGKWLNDFCGKGRFSKRIVQCSLCGNFLDLDGVNAGRGDANYCPNCGADMREES